MKKPVSEKAIKQQVRLYVIEYFIATLFAMSCVRVNPSGSRLSSGGRRR